MDDLISRQQAIDALDCINGVEEVLRSLPSAQPEEHTNERTKTHACDLISRQAVLLLPKSATKTLGGEIVSESVEISDIEELPSVQPEPQWIPCNERLPENKSFVLTTIRVPGKRSRVRSGFYDSGLFMIDNGDTWNIREKRVIAWMPLPEPYKGGK